MRMRKIVFASFVAGSLWATAAAGQPAVPTAPPVDPLSVSFEHDGVGVKGFALYISDAQGLAIRIDVGLLRKDKSGKVVAALPPLPPGTYTVEVVAYNQAGESPRVRAQPSPFTVTHFSGSNPKATSKESSKSPDGNHAKGHQPASGEKRGFLSRVYRGIVGADDEAAEER